MTVALIASLSAVTAELSLLPLAVIGFVLTTGFTITLLMLHRRQHRREDLLTAETARGIRELERWLSPPQA